MTNISLAQSNSLIGTKAPELEFHHILNYESQTAQLSDFEKKIVVIDFWATWCASCIEAFPKLERLQKDFNNDLQIITVTNEPLERIEKFLQKKSLSLPIVLDTDRSIATHFPHRMLPHTIIIDKQRVIRVVGSSKDINEDVIHKMLANEKVSIPEKIDVIDFDPLKPLSGNENFVFQATITPYQEGLFSMANASWVNTAYANRRILATNLSAKSLFEIAYQFPVSTRTIVTLKQADDLDWGKQNAYCFDLIVPEVVGDQRFDIMKFHLSMFFSDFQVKVEKRVVSVKVLKLIDAAESKLKSSAGGSKSVSSSGKGLSMKNAGIAHVAEFLEPMFNKPVIDDTGLNGLFDLELPWYHENPKQIFEELKKIGLELTDDYREVDMLIISDRK
ncbi:MAG TPA: redoxin domain-containing protein [Cyclobacteriaceae bacterium]|nr:redoxin domain-containing protein [Cyclobacteriaceae bacterium]